MQLPKLIGHRGACAYAPENTIASFNKAQSLGCRFIEFDVMCSQDGEPFVFHDETLKGTSNGKGDLGLSLPITYRVWMLVPGFPRLLQEKKFLILKRSYNGLLAIICKPTSKLNLTQKL